MLLPEGVAPPGVAPPGVAPPDVAPPPMDADDDMWTGTQHAAAQPFMELPALNIIPIAAGSPMPAMPIPSMLRSSQSASGSIPNSQVGCAELPCIFLRLRLEVRDRAGCALSPAGTSRATHANGA